MAAGLLMAGLMASLAAAAGPQQPAGDFKAKLDDAIAKLAAYDFGGKTEFVAPIADLVLATNDQPAQRKQLATRLATLLSTGAPRGAKDFVCRQLSIIGTANEVPALSPLLTDEKLSYMARYALERIPGPEATRALGEALGKVQGNLKIGVINSLGNRRDEAATDHLEDYLLCMEREAVSPDAAAAIGKIGPSAGKALLTALRMGPPESGPAAKTYLSVVADACLVCAEQLAVQGDREKAVAIFDEVRRNRDKGGVSLRLPKAVVIAATRGAILVRQAAGVPLLVEQIRSADPDFFALAIFLVRRMPGPEVTQAAAAELAKLDPEKQSSLIRALGDRGDTAATAVVLGLAKSGDAKVRPVAIAVLAKLGDASLVPMLLDAAVNGDGDVAQAAKTTAATLADKNVDSALLAALGKGDAKLSQAAIEILGRRHAAAAAAALLKAATAGDAPTRLAAIKALGDTATPQDFAGLVDLLVRAKDAQERAAWEPAIAAASVRMHDRDAAAEKLVAAMAQANQDGTISLLRVLGLVRGAKALEAVRSAVKNPAEPVRDAAVRALVEWPDLAAAADLLAIAKAADSPKHKILALRGYVRLIGLREVPGAAKLSMCRDAIALADRSEEKRLVLGALGGVQTAESLAMVLAYLDNPDLKDEAASAAVGIGEKLFGSRPAEVAQAMQAVLKATKNENLAKRAKEVLDRTGKK